MLVKEILTVVKFTNRKEALCNKTNKRDFTACDPTKKETGIIHRLVYLKLVLSSLFINSRISLMLKIFKWASSPLLNGVFSQLINHSIS